MPVRSVPPAGPVRPGRRLRGPRIAAAALAAAVLLGGLGGCGGGPVDGTRPPSDRAAAPAAGPEDQADRQPAEGAASAPAAPVRQLRVARGPLEARGPRLLQRLPGLGPSTLAEVPAGARQIVVVTGKGIDSAHSRLAVYRHTAAGWATDADWTARNALNGWTRHHYDDDLRSPIGVFGLTDAGGRMPDPGTKLPYDQSPDFATQGIGFEGESLAHSFDYVVAINYNRKAGVSPLDLTRPLGEARGGGIWFHVDHGGPTHGCVSLSEDHMKALLRMLDPRLHPVVVMGDAASLSH